jgi:hypothetical protein
MEKLNTKLLEDTVGANADNIASTDDNLSADALFQQVSLPSLGRQIFSVIPLNGPTGALFNIRKKKLSNDFELLRKDVQCYPSVSIHTGLTQEAFQDVMSQFGKNGNKVIGLLLRGLANEQENARTLEFLENNSLDSGNFKLSAPENAETIIFEITQQIHKLILRMNSKYLRTYSAFAVLPYSIGAAFMSLKEYMTDKEHELDELYISKVGKTRFFMSPDPNATKVFVGLKDSSNPSKSSAVFSPYASNVVTSIDPDTGAAFYHIYNRFAITASPLHTVDDEMLFKFKVTK